MPSVLCSPASTQNSLSTSLISSRVGLFIDAIAVPIFCTSRGSRYLKTSAASSSPSDMSRIALFCTPSLVIAHPVLHDVRHGLRVLLGDLAGVGHGGAVTVRRRDDSGRAVGPGEEGDLRTGQLGRTREVFDHR